MFSHDKRLQYHAKPDKPDPIYAKKLQEVIGGQWGEMSVMMQYLFQGWNCRGPQKYRDMILDIGTEEIGHVEMLATMVARLLEGATIEDQEAAARDGVVAAAMGGSSMKDALWASAANPQHFIVAGAGAMPSDSVGNRWTAAYITASGNLMADFRFNVTAESQGRLQVARLYEMTHDHGVRDMLSFLLARDTMHQNQWLAAIEDLEREGLGGTPVPVNFDQDHELKEVSYQFLNCSKGTESAEGRWAQGRSIDGKGEFTYVADPQPMGEAPMLAEGNPLLHGTPKTPKPPMAEGPRSAGRGGAATATRR